MGKPFKFESTSDFDDATVSFQVDKTDANIKDISELGVVWFDETFHQFRLLDCNYDVSASAISVTVPHFSIYCVVNKEEWIMTQGNCYFIAASDLTDNDNDGIPDCYESTNAENPENTYILSNGTTSFSLKGEAHSDKQITRDTIYDVVTIKENGVTYYTDGIPDGEEMVFCTGGDVNCDKLVDSEDIDLLQSYLSSNEVLSAIGMVNADCNLDGKIDTDDLNLINNFIENGYNNGALSGSLGDINRDGIVSAADLRILADFLLGRHVLYPVTLDTADFTGDDMIDSFDLVLMRQYLVHHSQSIAGFSYFYCVSDPMKNDTDGDLDWDQADPDPMQHQLNGYFAQKMGELQKAAKGYCNKNNLNINNSDYYNQRDNWMAFAFIRCFNSNYNWNHSNWNQAAGTFEEKTFDAFKDFLNTTLEYKALYDYFKRTTEIYSGIDGEKIDVYHMCATLSAYSFDGFEKEFVDKEYIDNLCGWSGDFQTLLNSAYEKTYEKHQYNNIYNAFYNQMGRSDDYFSTDDLYADVAALIINTKLVKNRKVSFESLFNEYFVYSNTKDYVQDFGKKLSCLKIKDCTKKFTFRFFGISEKIDRYNCNPSQENIDDCINAFIDYIYDNYEYRIT